MPRRPSKKTLSAVEKALRIVEVVAATGEPVSMAQIERATGLPRPTAHRVTTDLVKLNYLQRDVHSRTVCEGRKLIEIALGVVRSSGPQAQRREILADLARDTGETCYFGVLRGLQVILVEHAASTASLAVRMDGHDELPAHASAAGKLLLALLPEDQCSSLIWSAPLARLSTATITDKRKLLAALAEIRRTSIGIEDGEHIVGVTGIAVAVQSRGGDSYGAVALAAPAPRLALADAVRLVPHLRTAASRLATTFDA